MSCCNPCGCNPKIINTSGPIEQPPPDVPIISYPEEGEEPCEPLEAPIRMVYWHTEHVVTAYNSCDYRKYSELGYVVM